MNMVHALGLISSSIFKKLDQGKFDDCLTTHRRWM